MGEICFVLTGTAIPLIITGGFHADGFLDVSDSLCSYGSREKKLKILKDPHIGAFAVIRLAVYYLIYAAALLLAASMTTGIVSKVMYVLSAALFLYVCVTFGGFRGMFSGVKA